MATPALWNDSRTKAAGAGGTVGGKHATFTAGFWADGAIVLYFLLNSFV
jgi:hypothetical protein